MMNTVHMAYNSSLKASVMFWCIRTASLGMNLINTGITTCWYQSSKLVTSNVGISGTTDMFCGRYMSASSARVQLSRNWVRVVLLISDTFLWRNTAVQEWLHLADWMHVSEISLCGQCACVCMRECLYRLCEGHKLMNEAPNGPESRHESVYNL